MKTTIKVSIDCDGVYCGGCSILERHQHPYDEQPDYYTCRAFNKIEILHDGRKYKRCQQCLDNDVGECL